MNVTYQIMDCYDWDKSDTSNLFDPFVISQRDLWEMHYGGYGKNFYVHGAVTYTVRWNKGQTIGNGAVIQ